MAGQAIRGILLPDRAATLGQAEAALAQARRARAELDTGIGLWQDSEAGRAVRDLARARHAREQAELSAEHGGRWRDRRAARKEAGVWAQQEVDAQQRLEIHFPPMITRLDHEIDLHQTTLKAAADRFEDRQAASRAVIDYGLQQQQHARNLAERPGAERNYLDGVASAAEMRRAAMRAEGLKGFALASQQRPAIRSPLIEM